MWRPAFSFRDKSKKKTASSSRRPTLFSFFSFLIYDCNLTALRVRHVPSLHTQIADATSLLSFFFSLFHTKDVENETNKIFSIKQWTSFFPPSLRILLCQWNCPWKRGVEKKANTLCYNRLIVGYTVSTITDFSYHALAMFSVTQDSSCWLNLNAVWRFGLILCEEVICTLKVKKIFLVT